MSNVHTDPIASQRQALVTVEGIEGYFAQQAGGEVSGDTSNVYDGGNLTPEVLASPPNTGNLTLRRPYKNLRDGQLFRELAPRVTRLRTSVTIQDTDADLVPIGSPHVYADALLVGLTPPEFDAASGDARSIELVFAVAGLS